MKAKGKLEIGTFKNSGVKRGGEWKGGHYNEVLLYYIRESFNQIQEQKENLKILVFPCITIQSFT